MSLIPWLEYFHGLCFGNGSCDTARTWVGVLKGTSGAWYQLVVEVCNLKLPGSGARYFRGKRR